MVRLSDLEPTDRAHLLAKACPAFDTAPWVVAPPLQEARIALVTTAGLQLAGDASFAIKTAQYRVIPQDTPSADIRMSHASTNFDRTGFQEDINVVFPLERLHELALEGTIGSVAAYHYSFMGAFLEPSAYQASATEVVGLLHDDHVNVAFLVPV